MICEMFPFGRIALVILIKNAVTVRVVCTFIKHWVMCPYRGCLKCINHPPWIFTYIRQCLKMQFQPNQPDNSEKSRTFFWKKSQKIQKSHKNFKKSPKIPKIPKKSRKILQKILNIQKKSRTPFEGVIYPSYKSTTVYIFQPASLHFSIEATVFGSVSTGCYYLYTLFPLKAK